MNPLQHRWRSLATARSLCAEAAFAICEDCLEALALASAVIFIALLAALASTPDAPQTRHAPVSHTHLAQVPQ